MPDNDNPFVGVSFGRGVDMLLRDPSLAPKFDEIYTDWEEVSTLERARLHKVNMFYRGTTAGATVLKGLDHITNNPPEETKPDPAEEAREAWAQRLARGAGREFKPRDTKSIVEDARKRRDAILDDLAEYDRMAPAEDLTDYTAVVGGALVGGIPTPESLVAWPIRGATAVARMFWGGLQSGAVNVATDPMVQALNMSANIQKEYDFTQTVLAGPTGFVFGGGLVGAGEVVSRTLLKRGLENMAKVDPQAGRTPLIEVPERVDTGEAATRIEPEEIVTRRPAAEEIIRRPEPESELRAEPELRVEPEPRPEPPPKPEWEKIGEQMGSNPGGTYKDKNGISWYIKTPQTDDHVHNELLANKFYEALGVFVPSTKAVTLDDKLGVASVLQPPHIIKLGQLPEDGPAYSMAVGRLKEDFAIDAWLANWDVIGLTKDNILVDVNYNSVIRLDQGGALRYRAQGSPKNEFGPKVIEFESMRDPATAPEASKIFGDMTNEELIASIDKLATITPDKIDELVSMYGPINTAEAIQLKNVLKARRADLIKIGDKLRQEAMPVDAKGTPLPMDQASRWKRAEQMGFDVTKVWYHGTNKVFESFQLSKAKSEKAVFLTPSIETAQSFGGKVHEFFTRVKNVLIIDEGNELYYSYYKFNNIINQATADGYDAVLFKNVYDLGGKADQLAVLKPNMIRSTSAAFDPKKKASAKLAAMEEPKSFDQMREEFERTVTNDEQFLARFREEEQLAPMHKVPLTGELPRAPNYTRPPETVLSLQTMVNKLVETFGETIRQGRTPKKYAGTYNTETGVIHVNEFADFQVNAHEVAHSLANKLTGSVHLNGTDPLSTLAQGIGQADLRKLDYDQDPIDGQRVSEGFAEYIRLFMTHPTYLEVNAPTFHSEFMNLLEAQNPKMLQDLIQFQKAYKNYLSATPEQAFSALVKVPTDTIGQKILRVFTNAKIAPTVGNVLSSMFEATVNKDQALFKVTRILGKAIRDHLGTKYIDLLPSDDPRVHLRMMRKSSQTAMNMARKGVVPFGGTESEGPSLQQVITRAFNQSSLLGLWNEELFQKFGSYVVARRAIHLWDRYEAGKLKNVPLTESREHAASLVAQYEREYPQFKEAGDMFHAFNRNLLKRMLDSGAFHRLDQEAFDAIVRSEPFYVPYNRDISDRHFGTGAGGQIPVGIKAIHGSMRDIIHPINSTLNHMMQIEQQIAHAETMRALAKLAKSAGTAGGKFVEMLPAHTVKAIEFDLQDAFTKAMIAHGVANDVAKAEADVIFKNIFGDEVVKGVTFKSVVIDGKREPVVLWTDDGVLQAARLSTKDEGFGLYEIMTTMPKPSADLALQLTSLISSTLTGSITTHWAYALRNVFKDQFAAAAFVRGFIPVYHTARGFYHVVRDDEYAQAYRQFGGVNPAGGIVPAYADAVAADVKSLARQGFNIRKIASWRGLVEAITTMEMATRLGALEVLYKQKKRSGLSDYDAWISAVNETADLLPFDRYGERVETARHIIPFLNPWIQSLSKFNRAVNVPAKRAIVQFFGGEDGFIFRQDVEEAKTALNALGVLGITGFGFGAAYAAMMHGRRGYEDASEKVKALNFVVPVGDDRILMLPKPWELSLGFTAGEYFYANLVRNDPRAGEQFRAAVKETLVSPNLLFGNPLFGTTANAIANYNSFTGGPIVPPEYAKLDPEFQFNARTGAIAKKIGKITGWSPMKIDYLLSGYFGYYGRDLTMIGRGNQDTDLTSNLIDGSLDRAGLRDAAALSDIREKFWKNAGQTTGKYMVALNTYRHLTQTPETDSQAHEYFGKLTRSQKAWVTLNSAANELGKDAFDADTRRVHPLQHGYDAAMVATGLRKDVSNNTAADAASGEALVVNAEVRDKVARNLGQIAIAEMHNALVIMGEPGYAGRALIDPEIYMEQLRVLSPKIAEELANRYATKKIYKSSAIARIYEDFKNELLRGGSEADLVTYVQDVLAEGYEFGAVRRKRSPRRRIPIEGEAR